MIEIKEGKGFEEQMNQASKNISKLFNKNPRPPKHKIIAKEVSEMIKEKFK